MIAAAPAIAAVETDIESVPLIHRCRRDHGWGSGSGSTRKICRLRGNGRKQRDRRNAQHCTTPHDKPPTHIPIPNSVPILALPRYSHGDIFVTVLVCRASFFRRSATTWVQRWI